MKVVVCRLKREGNRWDIE